MASAITERDGSLSRSRYHDRAYTLPPIAFPADAPRGPRTSDKPIPTSALCTAHGAILEALYRISKGFWFSPFELVMAALLHFKEKVHRKDLARAEAFPLLMPRLLSQVLEHLGFPEEPCIERQVSCPQVLSI